MSSMWGIRALGVRKSMRLAPRAFWQSPERDLAAGCGPSRVESCSPGQCPGPAAWPPVPWPGVTPQPVNLGGRAFWGGANVNEAVCSASAIDCGEVHACAGLY